MGEIAYNSLNPYSNRMRFSSSLFDLHEAARTIIFNNPFDSFHNTVAEAKEEREQLDRLLTISTPRERLLVAFIALLLFILAAWLFFGSVDRSVAVEGLLVESGQSSLEGDRSVRVLVWSDGDIASHIEAGMPAMIELEMTDGEADTLEGEVLTIAAIPFSEELAALDSVVPVSVYRVNIALDEGLDFASLANRKCQIVIEFDGQSPITLFGMRRS